MSTSGGRDNHHNRWPASLIALFAAALLLAAFLLAADRAAAIPPEQLPAATIVFENGGRIVSIKADGTGRKVLTPRRAKTMIETGIRDSDPAVSPDGQTVLFSRDDDSSGAVDRSKLGLFSIDVDGGTPTQIRAMEEIETLQLTTYTGGFAWAPDGSRIYEVEYIVKLVPAGWPYAVRTRIISMLPDGSDLKVIEVGKTTFKNEKPSGDLWIASEVEPSPDGSELLVTRIPMNGHAQPRIDALDLSTRKSKVIEKSAFDPSFSPDGQRIVFSTTRDKVNESCYEGSCSSSQQLYLMDADGSNPRLLLGKVQPWNFAEPDWSGDGSRILLTSNKASVTTIFGDEIWSVEPDGSCLSRITNGSPASESGSWGLTPDTSPTGCGLGMGSRGVAEVEPPAKIADLEVTPLWLGRNFGLLLFSDYFVDRSNASFTYWDCSWFRNRCPATIAIGSAHACERNLEGELGNGAYQGMVRRKGGLAVMTGSVRPSLSTIFLADGREVWITSPWRHDGKATSRAWHMKAIDHLRPYGASKPPASFGAPVFAWHTVHTARVMVRSFRRTQSLKKAAVRAGIFRAGMGISFSYSRRAAQAWLRFSRDLARLGPVKSVECRRWANKPGTIDVRSDFRELIR